ncbi:MAG: flippase [Candidatus Omnitrophota bacterium]
MNKFLKETVWSMMAKAVAFFLFFALNVFLARKLGVESFGFWSLFLSIITLIFILANFGVNASAGKFVAQYKGTDHLKSIFLSSVKLRLIFSAVFAGILLLSRGYIAGLFDVPGLEKLLLYGVPLVFFAGFVEYFKSVFIGLHRLKYNFIINSCEFSMKLLLSVIFLSFFVSVDSVVFAFTLALVFSAIVGFYLLKVDFYKGLKGSDRDFTGEILQYSFPLAVVGLGFIVLTEIDVVMLGYFSSPSEVGIYGVAKQTIVKLPHIALAITMGTMPVFAKLNKTNKDDLKRKLIKITGITAGVYLVIVVSLFLFSPVFISLMFGKQYLNAIMPLRILCLYLFFVAISIVLGSFLNYTGRSRVLACSMVLTIFSNVALNIFLIPRHGAIGASWATSISFLPYVFLTWIEAKKVFSCSDRSGKTC